MKKKSTITRSIFIFEKQEDLFEFWNSRVKDTDVSHSMFMVFRQKWFHRLLEIVLGVDKRDRINFIEQEKV